MQANDIQGYDATTVSYHFKLLNEAGLIEAVNMSGMNDLTYFATSLTWNGHEFLDKIRNDSVWQKTKSQVMSKTLDLSFDVIKQVAGNLIKTALQ